MATTSRTKDKRGISPSNSQTSGCSSRGSTSSRLASSDKEKATEKPTPNYLKPTKSSRNELSNNYKLGNKQINNHVRHDQGNNQKLLSRRSFDKPPPSASPRGLKALLSPTPRGVRAGGVSAPSPLLPHERKITVRASSFGSRHTVTSTKTVSDPRVSKTPKAVRSSLSVGCSTPTKAKNPFPLNKKESRHNASSTGLRKFSGGGRDLIKRAWNHDTSCPEAKEEDEEDYLVKEVESDETLEVCSDANLPKPETDEEDFHVVETDNEDEKINSCDISSTCTSEDQNYLIREPRIDQEIDDHDHEQKLQDDQVKEDTLLQGQDGVPGERVIEEVGKTLKEIDETGEDDDESKNVSGSIEDDDNNDKVEEEKLEHGEEEASDGINNKAKEDEDDGGEAAKVVLQRVQEIKKESPSAAYNDVIEETASKLLEQKKNKVRALVGAFETVIDYESGSSKMT